VCIKLVAVSVNRYPRSSSQLHKDRWPLRYTIQLSAKRQHAVNYSQQISWRRTVVM